jgi:hypothetical protein
VCSLYVSLFLPLQGFGVLEFLAAIQRQADAEKQQREQQQRQAEGGGAQPEAPTEGGQ